MSETTGETAAPEKVMQPHGGALNRGGTKGNKGGRPPEVFKSLCRDMVSSPKARQAVTAILGNPDHPHFASMWKAVSERGYGKLEQTIEHVRKPYREAVDEMRKQAGLRLVG